MHRNEKIPRVVKAKPIKIEKRALRLQKLPAAVWHPPEIRHKDLTFMRLKSEATMNPRELRKIRVYKEMEDKVLINEKLVLRYRR